MKGGEVIPNNKVFGFSDLDHAFLVDQNNACMLDQFNGAIDGTHERILQILRHAYQNHSELNFHDLAPLIRQVSLKKKYLTNPAPLKVPRLTPWPDHKFWEDNGFSCEPVGDKYLLNPIEWVPNTRNDTTKWSGDIFADAFAEMHVRRTEKLCTDPFVKSLTGYDSYACSGQREALLSALFMPAGSTLIVNLPTGAGKTLVAQVPVLLNGLNKGLTIFIVPTVALAIDQERRMKELLSNKSAELSSSKFAFHGGLSELDRQKIKENIRNGTQGVVFTSPESATGALLPSLYSATKDGLLKYLFIDEAHLIAGWGDSFRPAFQALSGVRRGLLEASRGEPFRTVLMSATFTPDTVETIDKLFGPSQNIQMVSSINIRPEPLYWVDKVENETAKKVSVLNLVKYAPRPFILYVTKRADAKTWFKCLKEEVGYDRLACFTGDTSTIDRESIIKLWSNNQLDGIVATSAFGVGIDKSDVRTVIHATVPETLDRFYQEVGRGGRDGNASLSLTVFAPNDIAIANEMGRGDQLGKEKAFIRWESMFSKSELIENTNSLRLIDISTRSVLIKQESDANQSWNMRTLILLVRAGIIELASLPPESIDNIANEDEASFEQRVNAKWEEYYSQIPVRTIEPNHLNKSHFYSLISEERKRNLNAAERSLDNLMSALNGDLEMGDAISEQYKSSKPGREVLVTPICRGCPAEPRPVPSSDLFYSIPLGLGIEVTQRFDTNEWHHLFGENQTQYIFFPGETKAVDADLEEALRILINSFGIVEVVAPRILWEENSVLKNVLDSVSKSILVTRVLEDDQHPDKMIPLPRITLLLPWNKEMIPFEILNLDRPLNIIFVPDNICGSHAHKKLIETTLSPMTCKSFIKSSTT